MNQTKRRKDETIYSRYRPVNLRRGHIRYREQSEHAGGKNSNAAG